MLKFTPDMHLTPKAMALMVSPRLYWRSIMVLVSPRASRGCQGVKGRAGSALVV